MCCVLIEHGAAVNSFANNNMTPVCWTAIGGHERVCFLLIKHGALVNSVNNRNNTPWHYAGGYCNE